MFEISLDYEAVLTEMVLLGTLAARFQHQWLTYDMKNMQITNHELASRIMRSPYREGWGL